MKLIESKIFNTQFHIKYDGDVWRAIKAKDIDEAYKIATEFCKQKQATILSIAEYNGSKILELSTKTVTIDI